MSVLFTNNAQAECTMNEKFYILHETAGAKCSIENFEFNVRSASVSFVNKTRT